MLSYHTGVGESFYTMHYSTTKIWTQRSRRRRREEEEEEEEKKKSLTNCNSYLVMAYLTSKNFITGFFHPIPPVITMLLMSQLCLQVSNPSDCQTSSRHSQTRHTSGSLPSEDDHCKYYTPGIVLHDALPYVL